MKLITNNPVKRVGLEGFGLKVIENIPIESPGPQKTKSEFTRPEKMRAAINKFRFPYRFPNGVVIMAPPIEAKARTTKYVAVSSGL